MFSQDWWVPIQAAVLVGVPIGVAVYANFDSDVQAILSSKRPITCATEGSAIAPLSPTQPHHPHKQHDAPQRYLVLGGYLYSCSSCRSRHILEIIDIQHLVFIHSQILPHDKACFSTPHCLTIRRVRDRCIDSRGLAGARRGSPQKS
jgi:hypothetical protein